MSSAVFSAPTSSFVSTENLPSYTPKMSFLDSVKDKLSRKRSNASERLSRKDLAESGKQVGSNNPFLDPSSPVAPGNQTLEAPPAYSPVPVELPAGSGRRMASPSPSLASITSAEDKYAFLSTFDTIFVIDDSGSMAGRYWRETRDVLASIAPICTSHDPDGVDVYFFNHKSRDSGSGSKGRGGYTGMATPGDIQDLFESVRPGRGTPTGECLQRILKPYVATLERHRNNMELVKPINIIVITDGAASDDPESIICQFARKLDKLEAPPHQVGIQFFQVGNEPGAAAALRELDDGLEEMGIRDMVDTASWDATNRTSGKALTADGILKVVLGAVVRRIDRRTADGRKQGK